MFNDEERQNYEDTAYTYIKDLYNNIAENYNRSVTDWVMPKDKYSSWDMSATINGKIIYMENKTRTDNYRFDWLKERGFYLAAKKNDGTNTLFNYLLPEDNIIMITTADILKDYKPKKTYVKHTLSCDPDSPPGYIYNYKLPYEAFWVFQIEPFKLINPPKK